MPRSSRILTGHFLETILTLAVAFARKILYLLLFSLWNLIAQMISHLIFVKYCYLGFVSKY